MVAKYSKWQSHPLYVCWVDLFRTPTLAGCVSLTIIYLLGAPQKQQQPSPVAGSVPSCRDGVSPMKLRAYVHTSTRQIAVLASPRLSKSWERERANSGIGSQTAARHCFLRDYDEGFLRYNPCSRAIEAFIVVD